MASNGVKVFFTRYVNLQRYYIGFSFTSYIVIMQHFFALPFFLLFWNDMAEQVAIYNASPAAPLAIVFEQVPVLGTAINSLLPRFIQSTLNTIYVPKLWAFLALNIMTQ